MSISEYLGRDRRRGVRPAGRRSKLHRGGEGPLRQARIEFERGDLRQVSEKVGGVCALAIKAHALRSRGRRIKNYAEMRAYKNEVARELGDWVRTVFSQADSMHKNFYENLATREDWKTRCGKSRSW
jgi:hypothetical protein